MKKIVFLNKSLEELAEYKFSQPKLVFKVFDLLLDIQKTPFEGKGKPEPLKGKLHGFWSRRITDEHRLVYRVTETEIEIITCKSHYDQL